MQPEQPAEGEESPAQESSEDLPSEDDSPVAGEGEEDVSVAEGAPPEDAEAEIEVAAAEDTDSAQDPAQEEILEAERDPTLEERDLIQEEEDDDRAWYVVHCYSGNGIKSAITSCSGLNRWGWMTWCLMWLSQQKTKSISKTGNARPSRKKSSPDIFW
jgi:hypothetical protein